MQSSERSTVCNPHYPGAELRPEHFPPVSSVVSDCFLVNNPLSKCHSDLEQSKASQRDGRHEWSCFAAQQAAEKAVKALHLALGQEAWGHVIAHLVRELPIYAPNRLIEIGRVLDNFYIATRYANGHPEGAPFEHYGALQSDQAIRYASEILEFVRVQMAAAGTDKGGAS